MANRLQSPTSPFFLGSNDDQLERAQARAARAAAIRRKATTTAPPPPSFSSPSDPCLSKEQIMDLFQNCIKLASENKINQKNTWELKLIDHLSEIIKVETEGDTETNFQKASCTLEAGVKIYSVRVDAVHADTYKVLGGINRAALEDEQQAIIDDDNVGKGQDGCQSKKESEQKISPLSTLESSFETINAKKFDVAFAVDPLYHQTSAQFDEGGAKGLLLNNLGIYEGCRVLFDSFEVPGKCISCSLQNNISAMIDISFAKESIEQMVVNMGAKNEISPTLVEIVSLYDEDNERSSETFSVGEKFDTKADMFDPNDVELDNDSSGNYEAWTFNHDKETSVFNEGSSFDSTLQNHSEGNDHCTSHESDFDQSCENIAMFLFQGLGIASKQNTWAGPTHWKFRKSKGPEDPVTESGSAFTTRRKKSKNLAELDIDYMASLDREILNVFARPKNPKSLLLATRAPCSNTLPEDCHYQSENLVKLFLLPNVLCLGKRRRKLSDNRSWRQRNDFDEALPSWDNESVLSGQYGYFHGVEHADELTSQPRKVNKIEVQYDKTSKQVDVQALKGMLWDLIRESVDAPETVSKDAISFKHVLATFPVDCRAAAPEDISPQLCFICLLHLANEHGLSIHCCPSLDDLSIHLPPSCQNMERPVQFLP